MNRQFERNLIKTMLIVSALGMLGVLAALAAVFLLAWGVG